MRKKSTKILAMLLTLMMAVCFMPAMAFAEEPDDPQEIEWGVVPEGAAVDAIALEEETAVTIPEEGPELVTFAFTPAADGVYAFRSYGKECVEGGVLTPDGVFKTAYADEENDDWDNFLIYFSAKAGQTVYLQTRSEYWETGIAYKVKVMPSTVQAISYEPVDPVYSTGENMNGYMDVDHYVYDMYKYFETGDKLTVTFADPAKGTVTYTYDDNEYAFITDDGSRIEDDGTGAFPAISSDQEIPGKNWTLGSYPDQPNNYYYVKYKGAVSEYFPVDLKLGFADEYKAKVKYKSAFNYTTKKTDPGLKITYNGTQLIKDKDYEITETWNNPGVGDNYMLVRGIGEYGGEQSICWCVNPKGTSLGKLTGGKKCITVTWKKQGTKMKVNWSTKKKTIQGYNIEVATDKKFKKIKKYVYVKGYQKTSVKIKGLKANTKYYVRVSTYMPSGDIGFSSPVSKAKTVMTLK